MCVHMSYSRNTPFILETLPTYKKNRVALGSFTQRPTEPYMNLSIHTVPIIQPFKESFQEPNVKKHFGLSFYRNVTGGEK